MGAGSELVGLRGGHCCRQPWSHILIYPEKMIPNRVICNVGCKMYTLPYLEEEVVNVIM